MVDRDGEDSAPPPAPEASPAPDPLQRVRACAMDIHQILQKNYPDARLPAPGELTFFVGVCLQVVNWAPAWTPQALGRARKRAIRMRKDLKPRFRYVLPENALLMTGLPPTASEAISERALRLRTLKIAGVRRKVAAPPTPPGMPELPPTATTVERTRLACQGPLPRRWALVLRLIAPPLASILLQVGTPVATGGNSAFAKTCRDLLHRLLPNEKQRSGSTVSAALRKIVEIDKAFLGR